MHSTQPRYTKPFKLPSFPNCPIVSPSPATGVVVWWACFPSLLTVNLRCPPYYSNSIVNPIARGLQQTLTWITPLSCEIDISLNPDLFFSQPPLHLLSVLEPAMGCPLAAIIFLVTLLSCAPTSPRPSHVCNTWPWLIALQNLQVYHSPRELLSRAPQQHPAGRQLIEAPHWLSFRVISGKILV